MSLGGTTSPGLLGQEGTDGHLSRQPPLCVLVQERGPGHHSRHNRRRLQMHQRVAACRDQLRLVARDAVTPGNGLRRRERRDFVEPLAVGAG